MKRHEGTEHIGASAARCRATGDLGGVHLHHGPGRRSPSRAEPAARQPSVVGHTAGTDPRSGLALLRDKCQRWWPAPDLATRSAGHGRRRVRIWAGRESRGPTFLDADRHEASSKRRQHVGGSTLVTSAGGEGARRNRCDSRESRRRLGSGAQTHTPPRRTPRSARVGRQRGGTPGAAGGRRRAAMGSPVDNGRQEPSATAVAVGGELHPAGGVAASPRHGRCPGPVQDNATGGPGVSGHHPRSQRCSPVRRHRPTSSLGENRSRRRRLRRLGYCPVPAHALAASSSVPRHRIVSEEAR